jgi:hypothetical protein
VVPLPLGCCWAKLLLQLLLQTLLAVALLCLGLVELLQKQLVVLPARCPHLLLLAEPGSLGALLLPDGPRLHMQQERTAI